MAGLGSMRFPCYGPYRLVWRVWTSNFACTCSVNFTHSKFVFWAAGRCRRCTFHNRIFAPTGMVCYLAAIKNHPGMGGFPDSWS